MQRTVECFYPGSSFPAISITGSSCALDCKHCSRKYLDGMIPATTPEDLMEVAEALVERGAKGFLLSGGADGSGKVGLARFADAIESIKSTTDLKVNAHIGLTPADEIKRLVKCGIDSFSVDVYGSKETIKTVLGLAAAPEDYFAVIDNLARSGAKVIAPHICIGIDGGRLKGEIPALERLRRSSPKLLILISLIPTKGTAFEGVPAPSKDMVLSVIKKARTELPDTRLLMGCMRSKMDRSSELDFIDAGLDGIVLPSANTVESLKARGYVVKKRAECCSLL